jgi:hypothetical protein
MLGRSKLFNIFRSRNLYSSMAPKVLLTQILPPDSQKLIESAKDIELVSWNKTGAIPRERFLEMAKG